jgi:sterol desaturase/sphingolipid hydroxylase (fatty acid hydroxylase superfamily)
MLESVKALLQALLGPAYEYVKPTVWVFVPFFGTSQLNWLFIVTAIAVALAMYLAVTLRTGGLSVPGFFRFLCPKEVYLHPSAWVDCKYYVVNSLVHMHLKITALAFGFAGLIGVSQSLGQLVESIAGPAPRDMQPTLLVQIGYSLAIVAALDFAKWLAHYLQHKVPLLWEFHKVHHSAEVLMPLTNLRVHPVDAILENLLAGIAAGTVVGVYGYWYASGVVEITIIGISAVYFAAALVGNLRHSHIPLSFGPVLSKVLCSPAMHQIHHSCEPRHIDKNFSVVFSLWDYLAGTIYIPRSAESFRLGIGEESVKFRSVTALYFYPFVCAARRLIRRQPPSLESRGN